MCAYPCYIVRAKGVNWLLEVSRLLGPEGYRNSRLPSGCWKLLAYRGGENRGFGSRELERVIIKS